MRNLCNYSKELPLLLQNNSNFTLMSDGNYNRNLLPYQNFQSGLRAGRASMRTLAYETLAQVLTTTAFSEQEQADLLARFRTALEQK